VAHGAGDASATRQHSHQQPVQDERTLDRVPHHTLSVDGNFQLRDQVRLDHIVGTQIRRPHHAAHCDDLLFGTYANLLDAFHYQITVRQHMHDAGAQGGGDHRRAADRAGAL
jgi:hypothetical protein